MEHLIKRLEKSVAFAEIEGENMDDVSWGMQEGILISYNEAKVVIEALKGFKISSKPVLCGDSEQFYCWDEDALGAGSRCKVECDICKNRGQQ